MYGVSNGAARLWITHKLSTGPNVRPACARPPAARWRNDTNSHRG